ncbi:MAG: hypothetical protein NTY38_07075, partial [Acidobacteria bacterium]|nr:hypothetical protein [Acidobacteriota bacterium]
PADTNAWTYEKDLRMLRHANGNHLVNYTVVEQPAFYELADQLGILLFVELPFNQQGPMDALDARYPRREEYLRWSLAESTQIIRMLGNHPSIAVWSAISEVTKTGADIAAYPDRRISGSADGYLAFTQAIGEAVQESDPDALYHIIYCDFGEAHFWHGGLSPTSTCDQQFENSHTFVSEYGAMGFYSFESLSRIVNPTAIWRGSGRTWSNLRIPVDLKALSFLSGNQYTGAAVIAKNVGNYVNRRPASLRDYIHDSQLYQAFLYNYAGDVFRRRMFHPVNGMRSWHFKDFPDKPITDFGVIDCFHVPKMAYYAARRTWAPLSMSYAVQFPTESLSPGAPFKAPVWISNAANEPMSLAISSTLFDLKGKRLEHSNVQTFVKARQARMVAEIEWSAPAEPGIYVLRGEARPAPGETVTAEMYLRVAPPLLARSPRVLVVGTSDWTAPVSDYLRNLGAKVTVADRSPVVSHFQPPDLFPASPGDLRANFYVIWLAGFNRYWSEAPSRWTEIMVKSVELGVSLIHSGSWASFHGGGSASAALDLTPLADALPVEVKSENDVWTNALANTPFFAAPPGDPRSGQVTALPAAPAWLRAADFSGLQLDRYHMLLPRAGAKTLLEVEGYPLLVTGQFGAGRTVAYLGFSPETPANPAQVKPVLVDREIRARTSRLFFVAGAAALALASGAEPALPIDDLIEDRAKPIYETLIRAREPALPEVTVSWLSPKRARVRMRNGATYLFGLRLRLDGPDIRAGNALQLWNHQFFDLLPGERRECAVEIVTRGSASLGELSLIAEVMSGGTTRQYPVPVVTVP